MTQTTPPPQNPATPKPRHPVYPLTFSPLYKEHIWGGRNLADKLGRDLPDGTIAESWEVAAHPNGSSVVNNGPLAGRSLLDVLALLGERLVGSRNRRALELGKFPLLIKLLDANRWLSVQVHPDDEHGLANEGEFGKTEMWVVLHAEPGAEVILGFKPGVDRTVFAQSIADDRVNDYLHHMPLRAGDVVFVPAGAIHALGPGLIVAEIQQNSDTTYRVYDWGRPRPIHVEQALEVLDFGLVEPRPNTPVILERSGLLHEQIARCPYFQTERLTLPAGVSFSGFCDGSTYEIWGLLSGEARVHWSGGSFSLNAVQWVLLPASLGEFEILADVESVLLRVITPEG